MEFFYLLFLPPLLALGLIASYSDVKIGKIRNKIVLSGFVFALLGNIALLFLAKLEIGGLENFIISKYFFEFIINLLISSFLAIFLWYINIWAAGDAKFFIMLCAIIPLVFYGQNQVKYFPSFVLLFNIYLPVFSVVMLKATFYFLKLILKEKNKIKTKIKSNLISFNINTAISHLSLLFLILLLSNFLNNLIAGKMPFLNITIMIAAFFIFKFLIPYYKKFLFLSIITLAYFIYISALIDLNYFLIAKYMAVFMLLFFLIKMFITHYLNCAEAVVVGRHKIAPGMILTRESIKLLSSDKNLFNRISPFYSDGLSRKQARQIKDWEFHQDRINESRDNFEKIKIYKTMAFAPYMFLGAVLTIFLNSLILEHVNKMLFSIGFLKNLFS